MPLQNVKINMSLYMVTILAGMLFTHIHTPIHAHTCTFSLDCYCYSCRMCTQNVNLIDRDIPMYIWCAYFLHCYKLCNYACQVTAIPLSSSKGYIQSQPRSQGDQLSSTNLYIRGLSQRCTDDDLVKMCHQ